MSQAYRSVVTSIESDGGRVLSRHSVVVVHGHGHTGVQQGCSGSDLDVEDCTLLCYDRDATALLVPSRYVRCHGDPCTQRWYYPVPLTAHQAALLLRSSNQPGCFLVYRDADADASYQLAVCLDDGVVVHYYIRVSSHGDCALHGDRRRFLSVCDLVRYYQQNVGSLATRLRRPQCDATRPPTAGLHYPVEVELDRRRLQFTADIVVGGGAGAASGDSLVWAGVYDGRPVAVRVLHRADTSDWHRQVQLDDEFINETNTLIGLRHENIVRLIGVCSSSRPLLVVTERSFSGTLKDHLRAGTIPSQQAGGGSRQAQLNDIGLQVTSAVEYLASRRYVLHRAVTSSSFVVDLSRSSSHARCCRVKLTDFSRARRVSADDCYVADGAELVTVNYAAPEVLSLLRYSSRSDVWAVGILLWQASPLLLLLCFFFARLLNARIK